MALTEQQQIDMYDKVAQMHVILCDTNGNKGLCTQVESLKHNFYSFRLWVLVSLAVVLGGGGIGAWKVTEFLAHVIR